MSGSRIDTIIETAKEELSKLIKEPKRGDDKSSPEIDKYIRSDQGLVWTWEPEYKKNGQFQWCGAFAAYCYGKAGLKKRIRVDFLSSTARLYSWTAKEGKGRRLKPEEIQPGDVVVVRPVVGGKRHGNHICLAISVDADGINTIEGNAHGNFPDGTYGEGVISTRRFFKGVGDKYIVQYGIRFMEEDFEK